MHHKRKLLQTLLTLALLLLLAPALAGEARALTGTGTNGDPYQIGTAAELAAFRDIVNGGTTGVCAVMTADVTLSGSWMPIGTEAHAYDGTFNGNGHTVFGLSVDMDGYYCGLFGKIGMSATVENVSVVGDVRVRNNTRDAGGIVGYSKGTVQNCYHSGAVKADKSIAGGIVGHNEGKVHQCCHIGSVEGAYCAGGVVGVSSTSGSDVQNCHNTGRVSSGGTGIAGSGHAGGVVGNLTHGTIGYCYSTGNVSGQTRAGGVAGAHTSATFSRCYYLEGTAAYGCGGYNNSLDNQDVSGRAVKLTAAAFKTQASFDGWDFSAVWVMGADAPLLRTLPYAVYFNANKGSGTMLPQFMPVNTPTTLSDNAFSRTGYDFAGWNTAANGTGDAYAAGASITLTSNLTLYAQWTENPTPPALAGGGWSSNAEPFKQKFESPLVFDGGKVYVDPTEVGIGDTVTLTVAPDAGRKFERLTVDRVGGDPVELADKGNGVCQFEMPGWRVEVNAAFTAQDAAEAEREARAASAALETLRGAFGALLTWLLGGASAR